MQFQLQNIFNRLPESFRLYHFIQWVHVAFMEQTILFSSLSSKFFFSISKYNLLEQHYLQQITNTYTLFLLLTGMICLFLQQESSLSPHYSKISQIFLNTLCEPHGLVNCHLSHAKLVNRRLASWDIDIFLFWDLSYD